MTSYSEAQFQSKVDSALNQIKTVLHVNRQPTLAENVHHKYEDKYHLANYLTNLTIVAILDIFQTAGLSQDHLKKSLEWVKTRSVTLRLNAENHCSFNREVTRKVDSEVESSLEIGRLLKITSKTTTKITEFFWNYSAEWELLIYPGNSPEEKISLQGRTGKTELVTQTSKNEPPRPAHVTVPAVEVNITWLLQQINAATLETQFSINRKDEKCRTPRRNPDTTRAWTFFQNFSNFWSAGVGVHFCQSLASTQTAQRVDFRSTESDGVFNPVQPLFEERKNNAAEVKETESKSNSLIHLCTASTAEPLLSANDVNLFLLEQQRSYREKLIEVSKAFPGFAEGQRVLDSLKLPQVHEAWICDSCSTKPIVGVRYVCKKCTESYDLCEKCYPKAREVHKKDHEFREVKEPVLPAGIDPAIYPGLLTFQEGALVLAKSQLCSLINAWLSGLDYIEEMLRKQLISAIGKEIGAVDFINYMKYHQRKLYRGEFEPKALSYAVRRPAHFPEGGFAIEATFSDASSLPEPIVTYVRRFPSSLPMGFALNAATRVEFGGERYLHAWLNHSFAGDTGSSLQLIARARQFSSFIVLLGRINSATSFEPKYAVILQNKDDLKIPLQLEQLPTPKAFKDAVSSLSPEQRRFAQAYRSMQLEGSLFGIVIIQLKPQLEKLLNLPADTLTKEIELTQDLLELFIKYQIPSDQLSFDEQMMPNRTALEKMNWVKHNVLKMKTMLATAKDKELAEKKQEAQYARPDLYREQSEDEDDACYEVEMRDKCDYDMEEERSAPIMKKNMARREKESSAPSSRKKEMANRSSPAISGKADRAGHNGKKVALPSKPMKESSVERKDAGEKQPADKKQPEEKKEQEILAAEVEGVDFTSIPAALDAAYLELDEDASLRSTIINIGTSWTKKQQKALLADPETITLGEIELAEEKNKAFDLLDALSKSGDLLIDEAALHVIVAATHCFDKSLINTVVQDNLNPIEKLERSSLIIATTIHETAAIALIKPDAVERIKTFSAPRLLEQQPEDDVVVVAP
jgi:hypothetical protein